MIPSERAHLIYSLAVILLFILPGCQAQNVSSYYQGLQANQTENLPLPGKELQNGQWKTYDLLLDYQYQTEGNSLNITGSTTLSDYYQTNMTYLRKLDLFIFFLDKDSRILETAKLLERANGDVNAKFTFKKTVAIPPAAEAIAFGYRGVARDGRDPFRFDLLPKQDE